MKQELPLNPTGAGPQLPDSPGLAPSSVDGKPLTYVISRVDRIKLYYLGDPIRAVYDQWSISSRPGAFDWSMNRG